MKTVMKWLAFVGLFVVSAKECKWDSGMGASWDLAELQALTQGYWKAAHINTNEDGSTMPYKYYFGICENTNFAGQEETPNYFPDDKCHETEQAAYRSDKGFAEEAPAWQVNIDKDGSVKECYRLGHTEASGEVEFSFSLLDPADEKRGYKPDPSKGFVLKYSSGGDNDASGQEPGCEASKFERDLEIEFQCDEEAASRKPDAEMVFEDPNCTYRILYRSVFGCPTECAKSNGIPCAGNGVCGYNRRANEGAGRAQCFCDDGYAGKDCTEEVSSMRAAIAKLENDNNSGTLLAMLVIVFILLIAVVGVLGYMCYKTRQVLQNDKYVGLLGPIDTPHAINDGGEKL